jgi:hypothetical protein
MQKLIMGSIQSWFVEEVNKHLEEGWRVVPNSLNQTVYGYKSEGQFATTVESYAIVLEKPSKKHDKKKKLLKG